MSLPLAVVERLFERLGATYGTEFTSKFVGDTNNAKSVWAHELAGYANNLQAIAHALENLPEKAPNVIVFRNLCQLAPGKQVALLEKPKADPEMVKMVIANLKPAQKIDQRDWARKILENQKGRTPAVVQMAKNALEAA